MVVAPTCGKRGGGVEIVGVSAVCCAYYSMAPPTILWFYGEDFEKEGLGPLK